MSVLALSTDMFSLCDLINLCHWCSTMSNSSLIQLGKSLFNLSFNVIEISPLI